MFNARDAIEEIRHRVGIVDVVSEYVALKRSGKNLLGLCPFHTEKTPSFTVSEEFQTYHCFGCHEHGDIFSFVMKVENLTFAEALERLAKRAGVELVRTQTQQPSRRDALTRVNAFAANYYRELLRRTPTAVEYLRRRGLADTTIEGFRLGYAAPAWDGLTLYLSKNGVDLENAALAGLLVKKDRGGYYDRLRNRIVFPIFDIQDQVIGFGGRAIGDDQPKYLNSPETPLFSKTKTLYGLNLARKKMAEDDRAIVVEGYMDVIAAHQAGFVNCVATLGTALTLEHIKVLSRYTKSVALTYDADSAGVTAAFRGASMFEEEGSVVRIARLPKGHDPDSLLREGRTAEFSQALADALPILDYRIAVIIEKHDLATPTGKTDMLKEAVRVLAEVPANIERERHIRTLARYHPNFETGTTRAEDHIRRDVEVLARRSARAAQGRPPVAPPVQTARITGLRRAELSVLRVLVRGEKGARLVAEQLQPEDFSDEVTKAAAGMALEAYREHGSVELSALLQSASMEVGSLLSELALKEDWEPVEDRALQDCMARIKKSKLGKRTIDVLAPYIKQGIIDTGEGPRELTIKQLEEFLRQTGKLPSSGDPGGMDDSDS